jgi:hypothetical protein
MIAEYKKLKDSMRRIIELADGDHEHALPTDNFKRDLDAADIKKVIAAFKNLKHHLLTHGESQQMKNRPNFLKKIKELVLGIDPTRSTIYTPSITAFDTANKAPGLPSHAVSISLEVATFEAIVYRAQEIYTSQKMEKSERKIRANSNRRKITIKHGIENQANSSTKRTYNPKLQDNVLFTDE